MIVSDTSDSVTVKLEENGVLWSIERACSTGGDESFDLVQAGKRRSDQSLCFRPQLN